MVSQHILNKVVQTKTFNGTTQLTSQATNYSNFANGNYLPSSISLQILNNPAELCAVFNKYDIKGNILEMHKSNDITHSYLWSYNNQYPIAEAINATSNNIAYTSFEADGTGNWTIPSTLRTSNSVTGNQGYSLSNGAITKTLPSETYKLTVWATAAPTISGNPTPKTGRSFDGFKYYEYTITASSVTISGSATIDELRLYPSDAQITTYTYQPLIGITSQCDVNNRITTYEYDGLGRLSLIKDQDKNILKQYQYAYQSVNPGSGNACSTANCTGDDEKCVNGFCEKATRINTSTVLIKSGVYTGQWLCSYYYKWSDNTTKPADALCQDPNHTGYPNCINTRLTEYTKYPCDVNQ